MLIADLYFMSWPRKSKKNDRRVNGYFIILSKLFACEACAGSTSLHPLPEGHYVARNFRVRTETAMVRDGVGFSVDLSDKYDPISQKTRTLLRIHPDGGQPGTEGCIGIISRVKETGEFLKALFPTHSTTCSLLVVHSKDDHLMSIVVASIKGTILD
jgi:hypothetical protein